MYLEGAEMGSIDNAILDGAIERYCVRFEEVRKNEVYKWEAVAQFQDKYDKNAADIAEMLADALNGSGNLLVGPSWYPLGMLKIFAGINSSSTISALEKLFNEEDDLKARMVEFEQWAQAMLNELNEIKKREGKQPSKNHFDLGREFKDIATQLEQIAALV